MNKTIVGIDPGVVDTAMVIMKFDTQRRTVHSVHRVWTGAVTIEDKSVIVDTDFLTGLSAVRDQLGKDVDYFIEGYRNRGRNMRQDQKMTVLISAIQKTLPKSKVVDNTGVKKIVTEELLKYFKVNRWPGTNHADTKSAARIAIKGAFGDKELNEIIANVFRDDMNSRHWKATQGVQW